MKTTILSIGFLLSGTILSAQIYEPTTTPGSSNDPSKTIIGQYLAPASYNSQLLINTRVGGSNSTKNNLEINYSYANTQAPGSPYVAPSLSAIKARRWDANYPPTGGWIDVFDLKADGNLFLGTTSGSSRLNVGGDIEIPGASATRDLLISGHSGQLGWKANGTNSNFQNFSIRYMGDGTNPGLDLMSFKPDGGININGFICPDVDLAIKDNSIGSFTPQSKVHINTWGPTNGGEPTAGVYGLIVENSGWRAHDFALEVRSAHGAVFSVSNTGHVLVGKQGINGVDAEINKDLPNLDLYSMYVARGIRTERVRVDVASTNGWADFVFENDYQLMSLSETKQFIEDNGHLPGVPSAEDVVAEGIDLAEMNKILLQKIEELTLHIIKLEEKYTARDQKNSDN